MRKFLIILFLAYLIAPASVMAEKLDVLIQEKAVEAYGSILPESGNFDIIFQTAGIHDAVVISAFWMDKNTSQFIANAVTQDGVVRRIGGLAILTVQVPVPVRRLMPNEIVMKEDVEIQRMHYSRVGAYAVTDVKDLIGKQVRRLLTKGRPVMTQSVMNERIIDRGDIVEIRYLDGPLKLTATGRALGDAYRGQEIKIVNLIGNITVVGVASGEGLVDIIQ